MRRSTASSARLLPKSLEIPRTSTAGGSALRSPVAEGSCRLTRLSESPGVPLSVTGNARLLFCHLFSGPGFLVLVFWSWFSGPGFLVLVFWSWFSAPGFLLLGKQPGAGQQPGAETPP